VFGETQDDTMNDLSGFEDEESIFGDDDSLSAGSKGSVKVAREDIKLMNVIRAVVILILMTVAFISSEFVFVIATIAQENNFDNAYNDASQELIDGFYAKLDNKLWTAQTFSTDLTSSAKGKWPFVTFSDFEARCAGPRHLSAASSFTFSPLVRRSDLADWQEYAALTYPLQKSTFTDSYNPHGGHPHEAFGAPVVYYPTGRDSDNGIYSFVDTAPSTDLGFADYSFPMWQMAPSVGNLSTGLIGVLFNEMTNLVRAQALESMLVREGSVMSQFLFLDTNGTDFASFTAPRSIIYYPIYDSLNSDRAVVGTLDMEVQWESFLEGILDDFKKPLVAVVDNTCGGVYSYEVSGLNASFIGAGDHHDDAVDGYTSAASSYSSFAAIFDEHGKAPLSYESGSGSESESACNFKISVYATSSFKNESLSAAPDVYRWIVLCVLLSMVMIFICYDCLVERRQSRVVDAAERSDAIVRSLFPSAVRDRLYEEAKQKQVQKEKAKSDWRADPDSSQFLNTKKNRIKNFMSDTPGTSEQTSQSSRKSEPLADLFPNTTVLFADISGFTAWSSEREPSQVFTLLETLYHAMDKAAKKLGVFKVETIGDCYVAATGLPDPQANHAELMVRFARSCLIKVNDLTRKLEATLGPGTADLSMRFGIHSGPVTAGVLRGQKARFQLFGDTMNMAARMESSGVKNKIHLSQDTANLLIAAGRQQWVTPREGTVELKGKGEMQTYWLLMAGSSSHASSEMSDDSTEILAFIPETKLAAIWKGTYLEGVFGLTEVDGALARLVDWNVDVMLDLLKSIVARRIVSGQDSTTLSSALEKQIVGQNMVIDEVQMVIALPEFNGDIADAKAAQQNVVISQEVVQELQNYIACIASGYKKNSFHNFEHASHVILSATKLLKRIVNPNEVGPNQKQDITSEDLHEHTYGIGTDPLTQFSVVFSALIHDVGHTGVPNGQLAKEDPALAEKYTNKSVAEQNSVDIAWDLLLLPHFQNLRACIYQSETEYQRFRHLVVNSVMATDIFDKDLKALRNSRWDKAFHKETLQEHALGRVEADLRATIVIEHIIQASDVSHTMQHWHIYLVSNGLVIFSALFIDPAF
jgi:class 3 adenylate cyclase